MALPSSLHRFTVDLSDVDRGVYEQLEFRLVRHPSETVAFALVRVLAYALEYTPELAFGRGIGAADEPALSSPNAHGGIGVWLDVGAPSADRLHKASKLADAVVVYTHRPLEHVQREWASRTIHRAEDIRVVFVPPELIDPLEPTLDRNNAWQVLRTEGVVYVTAAEATYSGSLIQTRVGEPAP